MKKFICYLKAIPLFLKCGAWCPHKYEEVTREQCTIISTDNSFRISTTMAHNVNETVHPKATLIKSKCICCGKEDWSWFDREPLIVK